MISALRKSLGTVFGVVTLIVGVLGFILGVAILIFGAFILIFGQGHYPPVMAVFILPVGGVLLFVGYGAIRLGWDTLKSSARGNGTNA